VVKAVLAIYWSRLGSLNALAMTRAAKFWKSWLDGPLCSADSLGRIVAGVDAAALRQGIHHVYERLKRNKRRVSSTFRQALTKFSEFFMLVDSAC
jgi:hypothetical protein